MVWLLFFCKKCRLLRKEKHHHGNKVENSRDLNNNTNSIPPYKPIQMFNVMICDIAYLALFMVAIMWLLQHCQLPKKESSELYNKFLALACELKVKAFCILQLNHSPLYLKNSKLIWWGIIPLFSTCTKTQLNER